MAEKRKEAMGLGPRPPHTSLLFFIYNFEVIDISFVVLILNYCSRLYTHGGLVLKLLLNQDYFLFMIHYAYETVYVMYHLYRHKSCDLRECLTYAFNASALIIQLISTFRKQD